ncbi:MAG: isoamylase early set domain-containing protein [Candidatus Eisenbacteria bacterium]|nr:isoamylase early set domain-containing protein [Candidatus Eisenbacteria bacterium]
MKRTIVWAAPLLAAAVALSGCAGGWRGGTPPGSAQAPGVAAGAAPAAKGTAGAPGATQASAAGVTFVWKGEGGSVALAGEFNGWNTTADPMTKQADGSWTITKKLEPGRYQYKFVVDGSNWKPDPTATESADDGFGGKNSVIVVGGAAAPAPAPAPAAGGAAVAGEGVAFAWKGGGNSVALAGEFNGWNTTADPMTKQADGSWTITKKLEPGRYAYKFVVDGNTWKEDPTAKESTDDGFGGKNSVIAVGGAPGTAAPLPAPAATAATAPTGKGRPPAVTADAVVFTFAGGATAVALAGEFNGWSTTVDPMAKQADGTWTISKKLAPGTYAYKFVVNGTTWKQDDANPEAKDDGFGGKNSLVTVK